MIGEEARAWLTRWRDGNVTPGDVVRAPDLAAEYESSARPEPISRQGFYAIAEDVLGTRRASTPLSFVVTTDAYRRTAEREAVEAERAARLAEIAAEREEQRKAREAEREEQRKAREARRRRRFGARSGSVGTSVAPSQ